MVETLPHRLVCVVVENEVAGFRHAGGLHPGAGGVRDPDNGVATVEEDEVSGGVELQDCVVGDRRVSIG